MGDDKVPTTEVKSDPPAVIHCTSLSDEEVKLARALEEYKELGLEYRYRDLLMVQEFGRAMVALGVLLGAVVGTNMVGGLGRDLLISFATGFVAILALHLRNANQDRLRALNIRTNIGENILKFESAHLNPRGTVRTSVPVLMFRFTVVVALVLFAWTVVSTATDLKPLISLTQLSMKKSN